jgi:hypothetical protein
MNMRKLWFGGLRVGRLRKIHGENLTNRIPGSADAASSDLVRE